tara:strand:- start:1 stop:102 length:102 start_codon:yes stop_codon:yes gene_type:complete
MSVCSLVKRERDFSRALGRLWPGSEEIAELAQE